MTTHTNNKYRPDIDGLRAVAVLAVIFFHYDFAFIQGGYIGVDIFFVISGYLITNNIHRDIVLNRFSIQKFWINRARRILPACLLVIFVVLAIFSLVYPTTFYKNIAATAVAQTLFSSNILFWNQSGYFSTSAAINPLLHTWSLSIEEQFYFILPWILILSSKLKKSHIIFIISSACAVSLLLSVMFSKTDPIPAFYLLPTRAWELGFGSILALIPRLKYTTSHLLVNLLAIAGALMIIIGLVHFDHNTAFPSYSALLPVIGAALIIWTNQGNGGLIQKCLENSVMVGIGLMSYSLYLWHWPIIVFTKWYLLDINEWIVRITALTMTLALSYLTYTFIETPVRKNRTFFTDRRVMIGSIGSTLFILLVSLFAYSAGNSSIVDPQGTKQAFYLDARQPEPNREECTDRFRKKKPTISCKYLYSPINKDIDIFIWGDSHASAMIPAFDILAKNNLWNIEFSTNQGCQSVVGMRRVDQPQQCNELNNAIAEHITQSKFPVVILINSFVNNVSQGKLRDINSDTKLNPNNSFKEFRKRFDETVTLIKNAESKVLVYTEPPRFKSDLTLYNLNRLMLGKEIVQGNLLKSEHLERIDTTYEAIDQSGIDFRMDYTTYFCAQKNCISSDDGKALYKDNGHLSNYGAAQMVNLLEQDLLNFVRK